VKAAYLAMIGVAKLGYLLAATRVELQVELMAI
jgi:hypothetical protein